MNKKELELELMQLQEELNNVKWLRNTEASACMMWTAADIFQIINFVDDPSILRGILIIILAANITVMALISRKNHQKYRRIQQQYAELLRKYEEVKDTEFLCDYKDYEISYDDNFSHFDDIDIDDEPTLSR